LRHMACTHEHGYKPTEVESCCHHMNRLLFSTYRAACRYPPELEPFVPLALHYDHPLLSKACLLYSTSCPASAVAPHPSARCACDGHSRCMCMCHLCLTYSSFLFVSAIPFCVGKKPYQVFYSSSIDFIPAELVGLGSLLCSYNSFSRRVLSHIATTLKCI
jgi:hypothetical protein